MGWEKGMKVKDREYMVFQSSFPTDSWIHLSVLTFGLIKNQLEELKKTIYPCGSYISFVWRGPMICPQVSWVWKGRELWPEDWIIGSPPNWMKVRDTERSIAISFRISCSTRWLQESVLGFTASIWWNNLQILKLIGSTGCWWASNECERRS